MKISSSALVLSLGLFILTDSLAQNTDSLSGVLNRYALPEAQSAGVTIDAELAQRLFRRGNTYSNLERLDEAIEEYRKAIVADPNFAEAMRALANTYYFLGRYPEAKPLLARFISLQTETSAGLIASVSTLGEMERRDGNFDVSIVYDLKSIELDPGNDSQVHIMGNTYNNAGDTEKAILIYQAGIEVMPANAFFYRTLGRLLEQEGRLSEALVLYEQAVQANPDSPFYAELVKNTRAKLGLQ